MAGETAAREERVGGAPWPLPGRHAQELAKKGGDKNKKERAWPSKRRRTFTLAAPWTSMSRIGILPLEETASMAAKLVPYTFPCT